MSFFGEIEETRAFMKLPPLITAKELKKRYKELSKKMHPDCGGDEESMSKLSKSYKLLLGYMENYRFKLDEGEVSSQYPFEDYKKRFRF